MEHSVLEQSMQALYEADRQIVQLLTRRHALALELAQLTWPEVDPASVQDRVTAVLSRLSGRNPGPLDEAGLAAIFELVIVLTEPLSVGLSGYHGGPKKG